jgi:hypothetical protein
MGEIMKIMHKKHSGFAGLYFLSATMLSSLIMFAAVQTSWLSSAVAISDNVASIQAINIASQSYAPTDTYCDSYSHTISAGSNQTIYSFPECKQAVNYNNGSDDSSINNVSPIKDFCDNMTRLHISSDLENSCVVSAEVTWNKDTKIATVQYSSFVTRMGLSVRPHLQQAAIQYN